jgi:hypothetical protein
MSERDDYVEPGPDIPSLWSIFGAIGKASLITVGCGVLSLIVAEMVLGYNMYFASTVVWCAFCYAPAMSAGGAYFGLALSRRFRQPKTHGPES